MWIWQKKLSHALAVFVRTIVMLLCLSWRTTRQESRWHIPIPWPMVDPQVIIFFNSKMVIHDLDSWMMGTTILGNLYIYIYNHIYIIYILYTKTHIYCCPSKFPWMKTQISPSSPPGRWSLLSMDVASLRFWIFSFVSRSRSSPRHEEAVFIAGDCLKGNLKIFVGLKIGIYWNCQKTPWNS